MNRSDLMPAVRAWLETMPGATEAADWFLDRAETIGEIPKEPTLDVTIPWRNALESLLSARYVRLSLQGRKLTIWFDRWEREQFGDSGVLLPVLAEARGRALVSRRHERQRREAHIDQLIRQHVNDEGIPGHVARRELGKLKIQQGRFWSRSRRWSSTQTELEIGRYFALLRHAEGMRRDATRIERIVHVSRIVAGDTHWLRPRNRIWRDLAEDVLDFDAELKARLNGLEGREERSRALAEVGIVENLTSVVVMTYGRFALGRRGALWNWPEEAARQQLPIWLSAIHLKDSQIVPTTSITRVISIENETSFLDLIDRHGDDPSVILVYTEGQANRAVVGLIRLLSEAAREAQFQHQGDLDLSGVRILASLAARTGLQICPEHMDAETHRQFESRGISLSEVELTELRRALTDGNLPCQDLLERLASSKKRIEQESITANTAEPPMNR